MGTASTSNKDIADKLDTLIGLLTAQAQNSATVEHVVLETAEAKPAEFTMDADLQRQFKRYCVRWDKLAADKGERVVGYAYRNKQGQTKLWGCVESKLDSIQARDSFIGNVYATS